MAAKRRALTDIIASGLTTALCAGLIGLIAWPQPAAAGNKDNDNNLFNVGGSLQPVPPLQPPTTQPPAQPAAPPPAPTGGNNSSTTINMNPDEDGHDESLGIFVARGHVRTIPGCGTALRRRKSWRHGG